MKAFLLGDFQSDNGPGNANKQIRDSLVNRLDVYYSKRERRSGRIVEAIAGICRADVLVICSKSQINYLAIKFARFLRKRTIYILHGLSSYEAKINNPKISEDSLRRIKEYENFVFENVDKVVCVSKFAMDFLKRELPIYANKVDYIYNVVDFKAMQSNIKHSDQERKKLSVLSVGGGMRRKNNIAVSRALSLCIDNGLSVTYTVVGEEMLDGKEIKAYPFVNWLDYLPNIELRQLMCNTHLYIQDSTFETFGLAIVEALYAGCDLLFSANVGCKDLFTTLEDCDLIYDVNDIEEISLKAFQILKKGNNQRLRKGFSENIVSKDWQANKLIKIIKSLE